MFPYLMAGLAVVALVVGRAIYVAEADDKKRKQR
jgi:hypothetical protein